MAIDNSGISLDAGASDITYSGNEGPRSPQEQQMQQQKMASLMQEYKDYAMQQQEAGRPVMPFEEWVRSMQSPMAQGGRAGFQGGGADYMPLPEGPRGNPPVIKEIEDMREFRIANPDIEDVTDYKGYYERLKKLEEMMGRRSGAYGGTAHPTYTQKRKQNLAYGGIAGLDGRRKYGIGSWFQENIKDPIADFIPNEIKDNPLLSSVVAGTLLNQYGVPFTGTPGDRMGQDWFSDLISGPVNQAVQQAARPLGYTPDPAGEIVPGDVASGALNEPLDIEGWGGGKPQFGDKPITITQGMLETDKIPTGTGTTGEGWLYNLGQGAKDIAGGIGGAIGTGIGTLAGGAGQLLGGAGNIVKKGLETIIPGGETGYVEGGLYNALNPFSTAMASTRAIEDLSTKTDPVGNIIKTNGDDSELTGWRKALATVLPGGDPGYDLGKKILEGLGGIGGVAGDVLGGIAGIPGALFGKDGLLKTEAGDVNWKTPLAIGTAAGLAQKAMPGTPLPQDTSGIDIANIRSRALTGSDPDLHFLPPASATTAYAQGGRTRYATGDAVDQNMITAFSNYKNAGGREDFNGWFSDIYLPESAQQTRALDYTDPYTPTPDWYKDPFDPRPERAIAAQGGRIGAQEGGLMNLGGMEKDYRQEGGFVPLGGEERADDVPARLSKNEFVFTADAVRSAGGGDIDAGAEVMENVMNNLEQGGQVSEESQGLEGARDMFATSQRLEGVL